MEQNLGSREFKVACEVKRIVARYLVTQGWNFSRYDEWLNFSGTMLKSIGIAVQLRILLLELKIRKSEHSEHTRQHQLTRVWQQLECRIDVCRVTRGEHIEHL